MHKDMSEILYGVVVVIDHVILVREAAKHTLHLKQNAVLNVKIIDSFVLLVADIRVPVVL